MNRINCLQNSHAQNFCDSPSTKTYTFRRPAFWQVFLQILAALLLCGVSPGAVPPVEPPAFLTTDNSDEWEPGQLIYRYVGIGRTAEVAYMNGNIYAGGYAGQTFRSWALADENDGASWFLDLDESGGNGGIIDINSTQGTHGYPSFSGFLGGGVMYVSKGVNNADAQNLNPDRGDASGWPSSVQYYPWGVPHNWAQYGGNEGIIDLYRADVEILDAFPAGELSGVIGPTMIIGNVLFILGDETDTGVAAYDIGPLFEDPVGEPILLDKLSGAIGGYLPAVWENFLVFPSSGSNNVAALTMVDYSGLFDDDPNTNLRNAGTILGTMDSQAGNEYVQFQDNYGFIHGHKMDMATRTVVLTMDGETPANRPAATGSYPSLSGVVNTTQYNLPVGNLMISGGYTANPSNGDGIGVWVHQDEPDTTRPYVGYHVPRPNGTNFSIGAPITLMVHETLEMYTVIYGETVNLRKVSDGSLVDAWLSHSHDDLLMITPKAYLEPNTEYEVEIVDNGIRDAVGNGIVGYTFRFSTGSTVPSGNEPPVISNFTATGSPANPGAPISFNVSANDPEGTATLEYRFSAGDGSASTNWTANQTSYNHSYSNAGHYEAKIEVREQGDPAARSLGFITVTVATAPTGTPATNSGPIALDSVNSRVWVVNPDNDSVTRFDSTNPGAGGTEIDLAALSVVSGSIDPRSVAVDSAGNAWIACHDADRVLVLSSGGSLVAEIALGYGSSPAGAAASPDGSHIYITTQAGGATDRLNGQLIRFDAGSQAEDSRVELGPMARPIAISGDESQVLVGRFISGEMFGEIWEVDGSGAALSFTRTIALYPQLNQAGSSEGPGIPNYISSITITPDGQSAWYTGKKDNIINGALLSGDSDQLNPDTTVRAMIGRIDLSSNNNYDTQTARWTEGDRIDFDNADSPTAAVFSPRGDWAFVTAQGNNLVGVFDVLDIRAENTATAKSTRFRLKTGLAPQGLVLDESTNLLWVKNFTDRTVSVLDLNDFLAIGDSVPPVQTLSTVGSEKLPPSVLNGKQIFYNASDDGGINGENRMSDEGYISCATCHVDGMHDGRTFDFTQRGEGLRNTTDLRGRAGTGHGNVHWTANFDEIHDFNLDIVNEFGGKGFPSGVTVNDSLGASNDNGDSDLADMVAYVTSLDITTLPKSPFRNTDGVMTTAAQNGAALFNGSVTPTSGIALTCATCHDPSTEYTDSAGGDGLAGMHNVGTIKSSSSGGRLGGSLTEIDTPTLLGVWNTAPYFHNGMAELLDDVFYMAGGTEYAFADGDLRVVDELDETVDPPVPGQDGVDDDGRPRILSAASGNLGALDARNTVSGRPVDIDRDGDWAEISGIDGGSGGASQLAIRYASGGADVTVTVNGGQANVVNLPDLNPTTGYRMNYYGLLLVEANLDAGTSNTVRVTVDDGRAAFDVVTVSNPDDLAAATAHRQLLDVQAANPTEYDEVLAYILELDGRDMNGSLPVDGTGQQTFGNGGEPGSGAVWTVADSGASRIQAEYYDQGGEGVAYHDDANRNGTTSFRPGDNVDSQSTSDTGGGYNIGWVSNGEWLEYSINVQTAGTYDIALRVASANSNPGDAKLVVGGTPLADDGTVLGTFAVESTGGWQSWTTLTLPNVSLTEGPQILRIEMVGSSFNINWFEINPASGGTPPNVTTQPTGTTVFAGMDVNFSGAASGDPAPTIEWFKGSTSQGTGSSLSLNNVTGSDAGDYYFVATNSAGTDTSDSATLTVVTSTGIAGLTNGSVGAADTFVSRELGNGDLEQATNATGIGSTSDNLKFDFQSISGDFTAYVNLTSLTNATNARAGLMLRQDADADGTPEAGDAFVFLGSQGGGNTGYVQSSRASDNGSASSETTTQQGGSAIGDAFAGKWVMIERLGNYINLYTSSDGIAFDIVDTNYTVTGLSDQVLIGIATWSGSSSVTAQATFDSFTVQAGGSTLASDGFESNSWSGGAGWADSAWSVSANGGSKTPEIRQSDNSSIYPYEGSYFGRVRHLAYASRSVDLAGKTQATASFVWSVLGLSSTGERVVFEVHDGSGWSEAAALEQGTTNYVWQLETVDLSSYAMVDGFQIRFRVIGSDSGDACYFDSVQINAAEGQAAQVLDFGSAANFTGFGGNQDKGNVTVSSDGGTNNVATLDSNAWKSFAEPVTIGPNTRVKFSLRVTGNPEIIGISVGDAGDSDIQDIRYQGIQLYGDGSQNTWFVTSAWNNAAANWYDGSGAYVDYDILVSDFAPQASYTKIVFTGDDDTGAEAVIDFKNVEFYEP